LVWRCGELMIAINFLPWREQLRYEKRRKLILCLTCCLLLIFAMVSLIYFCAHHKVHPKIIKKAPKPVIKTIKINAYKLVGVIVAQKKRWALILLPNSNVIKVQQGDHFGKENLRVKQIASSSIKVTTARQTFTLGINQ